MKLVSPPFLFSGDLIDTDPIMDLVNYFIKFSQHEVKLSDYRPLSQSLTKWFNLTALELSMKFKFKYLITPDG